MYMPFSKLPESARIWIYQSNRKITDFEIKTMAEELTLFCDQWTSHSRKLKASFKIFHNYFIVFSIDEAYTTISGCSIDASVKQIKSIENKYDLNLSNRTQIAFLKNNEVYINSLPTVQDKIRKGLVSLNTKVFNNLVTTVGELNTTWVIFIGDSWLKKYFI